MILALRDFYSTSPEPGWATMPPSVLRFCPEGEEGALVSIRPLLWEEHHILISLGGGGRRQGWKARGVAPTEQRRLEAQRPLRQ